MEGNSTFTQSAAGFGYTRRSTSAPNSATSEFGADVDLRVYPNPAADWVNVELPSIDYALTVACLDGVGRLVWEQAGLSGGQTLRIPVGDWANGHYIIRVTDGSVVRQMKLQVNR